MESKILSTLSILLVLSLTLSILIYGINLSFDSDKTYINNFEKNFEKSLIYNNNKLNVSYELKIENEKRLEGVNKSITLINKKYAKSFILTCEEEDCIVIG